MSVKIRLKRFGTKMRPYYRIVVMDSRDQRDGRTLDEVGLYHPIEKEGEQVRIDEDKVRSWLVKGAQPTDTVKKILNNNNIYIERKEAEK